MPKFFYLCLCLCACYDKPSGPKKQKNDLWRSKAKDEAREERVFVGRVGVVVVVELAKLDRHRKPSAGDNVLDTKIRESYAKAGLLENIHDRPARQTCVGGSLCASAYYISRTKNQSSRPRLSQTNSCSRYDGRYAFVLESLLVFFFLFVLTEFMRIEFQKL